jgi:hypothetical protein
MKIKYKHLRKNIVHFVGCYQLVIANARKEQCTVEILVTYRPLDKSLSRCKLSQLGNMLTYLVISNCH